MRLLVARPQPEADATAEKLRALGHAVLVAPLLRIKPVEADLSGDWSAVIVTSINTLRAIKPERLKPFITLPLFGVGDRSARAAQDLGFRDVRSAQGDAQALAALIVKNKPAGSRPLLYLAGEDRAADIAAALAPHGIAVTLKEVYRAVATGYPPELFAAVEQGRIDAVLHFSRRSAEHYLSGARDAGLLKQALLPRHFCISGQVAEALTSAGAAQVSVAARADEAAVIALAGKA